MGRCSVAPYCAVIVDYRETRQWPKTAESTHLIPTGNLTLTRDWSYIRAKKKLECGGPYSVIIGIHDDNAKLSADRLSSGANIFILFGSVIFVSWEPLMHFCSNQRTSSGVDKGQPRVLFRHEVGRYKSLHEERGPKQSSE